MGAVLLYKAFSNSQGGPETIDIGALTGRVQRGEIAQLTIKANEILAKDTAGKMLRAESANPDFQSELMKEASKVDPSTNQSAHAASAMSCGAPTLTKLL